MRAKAQHRRSGRSDGSQTVERQLLLTALRALSIQQRQVLVELHSRRASVADAAATLGVSTDAIKSLSRYALHTLGQTITDMHGIA